GACKLQLLRVNRIEQQGHDVDGLRPALRIWLNSLACGKDFNILQNCVRQRHVSAGWSKRHQQVDARSGVEESCYAYDLIGANCDRAHTLWDFASEADARAFDTEVALQNGLFS